MRSNMQPLLLKSLAILLFLFIGLIYAFPGELQTAAHGVKTQRSGAAIYASSCTSCHGADGSGNTRRGKRKGAKDLRKSRISTARGISIITNGKGKMPAFESTLSAQEISRVNTFVRGLRTN